MGIGMAKAAMALTLWIVWLSAGLPAWALITLLGVFVVGGRVADSLVFTLHQQREIEERTKAAEQQIRMAELQQEMEFKALEYRRFHWPEAEVEPNELSRVE